MRRIVRLFLAVVLAPLLIPVCVFVGSQSDFKTIEAGTYFGIGFAGVLVVGVPAYLLLTQAGRYRAWQPPVIGALVAVVVGLVIDPGNSPAYFLPIVAAMGSVTGFAFYCVAPRPSISA